MSSADDTFPPSVMRHEWPRRPLLPRLGRIQVPKPRKTSSPLSNWINLVASRLPTTVRALLLRTVVIFSTIRKLS